jgi:hypothetical protein
VHQQRQRRRAPVLPPRNHQPSGYQDP